MLPGLARAPLVLASGSPRRSDLLHSVGLDFTVRPADIDESQLDGERPEAYVLRLAAAKAQAVAGSDEIVLGADTAVVVAGELLAKPVDADDARRMLRLLSGRAHRVHTGVAVLAGRHEGRALVSTDVVFVDLDDATVDWYVATGEPAGKAGGYAIQGAGARSSPASTAARPT